MCLGVEIKCRKFHKLSNARVPEKETVNVYGGNADEAVTSSHHTEYTAIEREVKLGAFA